MKSKSIFVLRFGYILLLADALLFGMSDFSLMPYAGVMSNGLRVVAFLLLLLRLGMLKQLKKRKTIYMLSFCTVFLLSFFLSRVSHMYYMAMAFLISYQCDFRKLVQFDFKVRATLIALILFFCFVGILDDYTPNRVGTSFVRHSYGFKHPNALGNSLLILGLEALWLYDRKPSAYRMVLAAGFAVLIDAFSDSRTATICVLLFYVLGFVFNHYSIRRCPAILRIVVVHLATIIFLLNIILLFTVSSNHFAQLLDQLLTGRFTNAWRVYQRYGWTLLGQNVHLVSTREAANTPGLHYALLDIASLRMIIQCGIVPGILMLWLYRRAIEYTLKTNDSATLKLLVTFVIFSIGESTFNHPLICFGWLYVMKVNLELLGRKRDCEYQKKLCL